MMSAFLTNDDQVIDLSSVVAIKTDRAVSGNSVVFCLSSGHSIVSVHEGSDSASEEKWRAYNQIQSLHA